MRLPASYRPQKRAHRHPRQDHQGLRHGRGRRGQEHHPSAKKAQRGRDPPFPHPLRYPHLDDAVAETPFYRPSGRQPGNPVHPPAAGKPRRLRAPAAGNGPPADHCRRKRCGKNSKRVRAKREFATTMAFVAVMRKLMQDKQIGKLVVPIVPDESRTFGMEPLFRQFGIYSSLGQLYEPVDKDVITYYKEGQRRPDTRRGHHRGRLYVLLCCCPARPMPPTASTPSPSSSTTRCSGCSGSAIWSG